MASLEVVLGLAVPPQVYLALEALGAELTAEGLEAGVLAAVRDEVGALAEGLPAHLALVRLLPWEAGIRWARVSGSQACVSSPPTFALPSFAVPTLCPPMSTLESDEPERPALSTGEARGQVSLATSPQLAQARHRGAHQ